MGSPMMSRPSIAGELFPVAPLKTPLVNSVAVFIQVIGVLCIITVQILDVDRRKFERISAEPLFLFFFFFFPVTHTCERKKERERETCRVVSYEARCGLKHWFEWLLCQISARQMSFEKPQNPFFCVNFGVVCGG